MPTDLEALLREVKETHERLGRRLIGLGDRELDDLQRALECPIPRCLRDVLSQTGLLTNPFRIEHTARHLLSGTDRFREAAEFELEEGRIASDSESGRRLQQHEFIAMRSDEAGNLLAIAADDDDGADVWELDYELSTFRRAGSFVDFLRSGWAFSRELLGAPREWSIQFSITADPQVVRALADAMNGHAANWEYTGESSAKVRSWESVLHVDGEPFRVGRLEYAGWAAPMISINVADPEWEIGQGRIDRFRAALTGLGFPWTEVDYGLLSAEVGRRG